MQYYRCKCGEAICYGSMSPSDCEGCTICNTTYAQHPDNHQELKPHVEVTKYDQNTGKPFKICSVCFKKLDENGIRSNG